MSAEIAELKAKLTLLEHFEESVNRYAIELRERDGAITALQTKLLDAERRAEAAALEIQRLKQLLGEQGVATS